jgi:hypothetical protein
MNEGVISMVCIFPKIWPPLEDFILFEEKNSKINIQIICKKEGQFLITTNRLKFTSQKVVFTKAKRALVLVTWDEKNGISLRINLKDVNTKKNTDVFEIITNETIISSKISFEHELAYENCKEWTKWRIKKFKTENTPGKNRAIKSIEEQFEQLEIAIYSLKQHSINFKDNEKAFLINSLPLLRSLLFWPDGKTKNYNPLLLRLAGVIRLPLPVYAFKDRMEEVKNNPLFNNYISHRVNNNPSVYQTWSNEKIMDFQEWLNTEIIRDNVDYEETYFRWKDLIFEGANTVSATHFDVDTPFIIKSLEKSKSFNRNNLFKYISIITQITIEMGNYIIFKNKKEATE